MNRLLSICLSALALAVSMFTARAPLQSFLSKSAPGMVSNSVGANHPPLAPRWSWPLARPIGLQSDFAGPAAGSAFGFNLAAGNLNGDAHMDLILSAHTVDTPSLGSGEGEVYVLLGPLPYGQAWTMPEGAALRFQGAENQGYLGGIIDSGDLNGDEYDDLVMGSWATGKAYVYLGSQQVSGSAPQTIPVTAETMALTVLNASGGGFFCELNGDGYEDLLLQGSLAAANEYRVWAILGRPDFSLAAPKTLDTLTQADLTLTGFQQAGAGGKGDNLGCGDVDGDGYNDLVVGASGESPGGRVGAGTVYVVKGGPQFVPGEPLTLTMTTQADAIIPGIDGDPVAGAIGDGLGQALAVADLTGDGRADLLLGAPGSEGKANATDSSGEVVLWPGRALHGQTVDLAAEAAWTLTSDEPYALFGGAIDTGDFDGDGQLEILLGCAGCGRPTATYLAYGRAYVVEAGLPPGVHKLDAVARLAMLPGAQTLSLGAAVAAADLDDDGLDELVLGAPSFLDEPGDPPGGAFVLAWPDLKEIFLPFLRK